MLAAHLLYGPAARVRLARLWAALVVGLLWASACNEISGASGLNFSSGGAGQGGAGKPGASSSSSGMGASTASASSSSSSSGIGASSSSTTTSSGGGPSSSSTASSSSSSSGTVGPPTAQQLLGLTASCKVVSTGKYQNDIDSPTTPTIDVCGLNGAVFWKAGMSIDCDGKSYKSLQCPSMYSQTAATDSMGQALSSVDLPFVVVPATSGCTAPWNYQNAGLKYGSVIAVIANGMLSYGVFGDVGSCNTIGQASYAMASSVGVYPGPGDAGTPSGVTYIAFVGAGGVASPIADHAAAVTLGQQLAQQLLANN